MAAASDKWLLEVRELHLAYGEHEVVHGLSFSLERGSIGCLLGPSGCGKTTVLRCIAGFEAVQEGEIRLNGKVVSRPGANLPPEKRRIGMVFQDYALFPHMTVGDNVAYGLAIRKIPRAERTTRVTDALRMVRLEGYEGRRPAQLSGGQRQRVALARALVNRPRVLLLDEPLGALDLKLRQEMQIELKAIQDEVGITFIYVTHDQEEALTMSDRIAVMSNGRVEQVGPPKEVYEEPSTAYVADFLGVSNLMDAKAAGATEGGCRVTLGEFALVAGQGEASTVGDCKVTIRPERVDLEPAGGGGQNAIPAIVERVVYVGSTLQVIVHLASGQTIQAWTPNDGDHDPHRSGDAVTARFPGEALRVLPLGEVSEEGFAAAAAKPA